MIRHLVIILALSLVISCGKKKVEEGTTEVPGETSTSEPVDSSKIVDESMKFNASGSDSGQISGLNTIYFSERFISLFLYVLK